MTIERGAEKQLAIVDLERATHALLQLSGSQPVYSPSGHIAFRQGATVLAARFDLGRLAVVGDAVPVLEGVRRGPYLAADGTMVYVPERGDSSARLVWVDRSGRPTPIPGERLDYSHLALDGGGRQALLDIGRELYVRDIERGTRRLLSSDDGSFPIWSADARWAIFGAAIHGKNGLFRQPADGSAGPESLYTGEGRLVPSSWNSRTGELAFFDGASDIWILSPDGKARRFLGAPFNERSGHFSPDGRWLAYVSDETGSYQVYVVPYPGPGAKVAVSVDGGLSPVWSSSGRELFYCRGGKMLAATLTFTPTLLASKPVELFDGPYTLDLMGHQRYDVAPDGRFLMVENSDDFRIVLVQNWAEELYRPVPGVTRP
jgi:Tol biopolymer transport system component